MPILDSSLLYKTLGREEFDYSLLANTLKHLGYTAPTKKIHELMKSKMLLGIKKGIYVFSPDYARVPLCKETLANLIYGPSVISLEYALSYYGLIPERVEQLTSVTPKRDKNFDTPLGIFTYRYLSVEKYSEGINLIWLDAKHPVLMATPEKALCDYVLLHKISFETTEQVREFFSEDLRMDSKHWENFDLLLLHQLNRVYRNKNIDCMIAFLERIKK